MNREEFEKIFDETESDLNNCGTDNCMLGLLILAKYMNPNEKTLITYASHDKVWSVSLDDIIEAGITAEDVTALRVHNWMIEDENDCLACFV